MGHRRFMGHVLHLPTSKPVSVAINWTPKDGNDIGRLHLMSRDSQIYYAPGRLQTAATNRYDRFRSRFCGIDAHLMQ